MSVITTGSNPKLLFPGVHKTFGQEYNKHPLECDQMFDMNTSSKAYEEDVRVTGFGLAPVKAEGASTSYTSSQQADTTRYTNVAYSLGFIVSREEVDDNLYKEVGRRRATSLAFSMKTTKEVVGANIFNRAFNAAFVGGDGVEMCSAAHPSAAGNQSNELAVAADLSEASVETMLIQIMNATNYEGLQIALRGMKLLVAPNEAFNAERILKSNLRSGTDFNDVNAIKSMGLLPQGYMVNHYFTDADAWFIKTDAPSGLQGFNRTGLELEKDGDFDTGNRKHKAYERYAFGWTDWLGVYGSPGA